jgi:hypothetical protein
VLIIAINSDSVTARIDLETVGMRLHAQPSQIIYSTNADAAEEVEILWTADNLFLELPPRMGIVLG